MTFWFLYSSGRNDGALPPRLPRRGRCFSASSRSGQTHRIPCRWIKVRGLRAPYALSTRTLGARPFGHPGPIRGMAMASSTVVNWLTSVLFGAYQHKHEPDVAHLVNAAPAVTIAARINQFGSSQIHASALVSFSQPDPQSPRRNHRALIGSA